MFELVFVVLVLAEFSPSETEMDSNCGGPKEFPASVLVNAIFKSSRSFRLAF